MNKRKKHNILQISLIVSGIILIIILGLIYQLFRSLPDVTAISNYTPFETTEIFSANGEIIASLHREENRTLVHLSEISPYLQKAVIAAEDAQFFEHHGVNFKGMARAFINNFMRGGLVQGGSTITQQLARSLFLTQKKTFTRKIMEVILALQIERHYTKEEILELYLNMVYWGQNAYGAEAAAQIYFGKHAKSLTLPESAMLAGIISGPELYSPYKNPNGAKERQKLILGQMRSNNFITDKEYEKAVSQRLFFTSGKFNKYKYAYPYFTSYVINSLAKKYGPELVYNGGLRIYTTLDTRLQKHAEAVVYNFLRTEGPRYNFTQSALLCLDPRT
ncbi:MAG: transglycosylase domain-containing protein, partial [bacterium]